MPICMSECIQIILRIRLFFPFFSLCSLLLYFCCRLSLHCLIVWIQHISLNHSPTNGYLVLSRNIENIFLMGDALLLIRNLFWRNSVYQFLSYKVCAFCNKFPIALEFSCIISIHFLNPPLYRVQNQVPGLLFFCIFSFPSSIC